MFLLIRMSNGEKRVIDEKFVTGAAHVGKRVTVDGTEEEGEVVEKGGKRVLEAKAKQPEEPAKKKKKAVPEVFLPSVFITVIFHYSTPWVGLLITTFRRRREERQMRS